jgi:MarR family transcriptional regulator, organic hydroperoxide resistance regulator
LFHGGDWPLATAEFERQTESIEALIRNVSVIIRKRGREILSNFGITPPQLNALVILKEQGEITMGELCDHMYLACSTATDLIDRMERNGLIARERDQNDRRVIRLKVLAPGRQIIDEVMKARKRYLGGVLQQVPEDERDSLIRYLGDLYTLMQQAEVEHQSEVGA